MTFSSTRLSRIDRHIRPYSVVDSLVVPATTVLTQNDLLHLCIIPAFSVLATIWLKLPDLDTGSTLTFSLEDNVVPTVYLASITTGQGGGYVRTGDLTTLGIEYSSEAILQLLVTGSATGGQSTAQTISFAAIFAPTKAP